MLVIVLGESWGHGSGSEGLLWEQGAEGTLTGVFTEVRWREEESRTVPGLRLDIRNRRGMLSSSQSTAHSTILCAHSMILRVMTLQGSFSRSHLACMFSFCCLHVRKQSRFGQLLLELKGQEVEGYGDPVTEGRSWTWSA